ncbi:MAG: hypothetical protein LAQ30_21755 [Acidobacteriia bacterium]|nr:hypothetical protein [Terriglobia bacterium]
MLKSKQRLLPLLGLALAGTALAQTVEPARFYKLEFVVKEVEGGKTVNARSFVTMLAAQMPGRDASSATIRAGGRVPVSAGSGNSFLDVGVNIDARELREVQGDLSLYISADISTIGQDNLGTVPGTRQNRWVGTVFLPVKKPTVVFASDDISSKRQIQLEVTATPVR